MIEASPIVSPLSRQERLKIRKRRKLAEHERFLGGSIAGRLERRSIPEPNSGCLLWFGRVNGYGYGVIQVNWKEKLAHRLAWECAFGPIQPDKPQILHKCDVPCCVNPDHLWAGTNADNVADMVTKGRARGASGEAGGGAKLSKEQVQIIRDMPGSQSQIGKQFGVSQSNISRIKRGETWVDT